jgi:hypothetical protein
VADLLSTISANYVSVGLSMSSPKTKYVNVDPAMFQGNWSGKYANNDKFNIQISNVTGFRAKVKYQSGSTVKYQDVLINNNSFKVGDSKFTLTKAGTAQVKTVVINPADGSTVLNTAYAKQNA